MAIDKEAFKRSAQTKPSFPFKQGAAALARHDLGPLETWTQVGANPTNCLYRATGPNGIFFVKIKFRATSSLIRPGPSLAVEADLAAFLRANTTLPLPPICLFDEDSDIFGHSFLVSAALPGQGGRFYFEDDNTTFEQRRNLLRQFGTVVATINKLKIPQDLVPLRDMSRWREDILARLLNNTGLLAALPNECKPRIEAISRLLEGIDLVPPPAVKSLLWGDAALHNVLVDKGRICGVYDFEDGAYGSVLEDQLHIASEYTRGPQAIYGRPGNAAALWDGYAEAGGQQQEPDEIYLKIRKATMGAGLCWFWEVLGVLHPKTPQWLEDLEDGLRSLSQS